MATIAFGNFPPMDKDIVEIDKHNFSGYSRQLASIQFSTATMPPPIIEDLNVFTFPNEHLEAIKKLVQFDKLPAENLPSLNKDRLRSRDAYDVIHNSTEERNRLEIVQTQCETLIRQGKRLDGMKRINYTSDNRPEALWLPVVELLNNKLIELGENRPITRFEVDAFRTFTEITRNFHFDLSGYWVGALVINCQGTIPYNYVRSQNQDDTSVVRVNLKPGECLIFKDENLLHYTERPTLTSDIHTPLQRDALIFTLFCDYEQPLALASETNSNSISLDREKI
jgi:hypothetical protein